jgi:hypothetical protein
MNISSLLSELPESLIDNRRVKLYEIYVLQCSDRFKDFPKQTNFSQSLNILHREREMNVDDCNDK